MIKKRNKALLFLGLLVATLLFLWGHLFPWVTAPKEGGNPGDIQPASQNLNLINT